MQLIISNYKFTYVCTLEPEIDEHGKVRAFYPHLESANLDLEIHQYGLGPFCRFRIPNKYSDAGVYAITVEPIVGADNHIKYIGESRNLAKRYNSGYGRIFPRNCFVGGRRTNCRVNNLMYQAVSAGQCVHLWFLQTEDYKTIEAKLIAENHPAWNKKGVVP